MKPNYVFVNDLYYQTLKSQMGGNMPVFIGARQRGGGVGSFLAGVAKYAIPLFARYILPHAKEAAIRSISDVTRGSSVKSTVKSRGLSFLKNVGSQIVTESGLQKGQGIIQRKRKYPFENTAIAPIKIGNKPLPKNKKNHKDPKQAKSKTRRRKIDVFS